MLESIYLEEHIGWISSRNITQKFWTCIVSPSIRKKLGRKVPRDKILIFSIWVRVIVSRVNRPEIWNFYNSNFSSWSRRPARPLSSPRQVSLGKRDFELVSPGSYARDRRDFPSNTFVLGSNRPVRVSRHSSEKFNFLHVVRKNRYPLKKPGLTNPWSRSLTFSRETQHKQELHFLRKCLDKIRRRTVEY